MERAKRVNEFLERTNSCSLKVPAARAGSAAGGLVPGERASGRVMPTAFIADPWPLFGVQGRKIAGRGALPGKAVKTLQFSGLESSWKAAGIRLATF